MTQPGLLLRVKPVDAGFEGGCGAQTSGEDVLRAIAEFSASWEADPGTTGHAPAQSSSCSPRLWGAGLLQSTRLPLESSAEVRASGGRRGGTASFRKCLGGGGRGRPLLPGRGPQPGQALITTSHSVFLQIPTSTSFSIFFVAAQLETFLCLRLFGSDNLTSLP